MKKSVTIRVLCLIIAGVILSGAVAFAAVMGSPYDTLKRAALRAATYSNVTIESNATLSINGAVHEVDKSHNTIADNGELRHTFDSNGNLISFYLSTNGLNMSGGSVFTDASGADWYSASVSPRSDTDVWSGNVWLTPEDLNSASMRFTELLIDAIVGDLKNNITMTSTDGIRTVRGTLTENQIPELVKAGIDMMLEQQGSYSYHRKDVSFDGSQRVYEEIRTTGSTKTATVWSQSLRAMTPEEEDAWEYGDFHTVFPENYWGIEYIDDNLYIVESQPVRVNEYTAPVTRSDFTGRDPWDVPLKSLLINYVRGEADIDSDGNLLSISGSASATATNIFGESDLFEFEMSVSFSDIGTSRVTNPFPGADQILTSENMLTLFGSERVRVYFTLNEDGSINENSLTTAFPGEQDISERRYRAEQDGLHESLVIIQDEDQQ